MFKSAVDKYIEAKTSGSMYHPNLAVCFNNVGQLYADMEDYKEAIDYFTIALKIHRQISPGDYTKVKEYYDRSLHFYMNSVPSDHPDLIRLYRNMIVTFKEMKEYARALGISEQLLSLS